VEEKGLKTLCSVKCWGGVQFFSQKYLTKPSRSLFVSKVQVHLPNSGNERSLSLAHFQLLKLLTYEKRMLT